MRRLLPLLLIALSACALPARAGTLADVEVYDRSSGAMLPLYRHEGRLYVAGEPRHEYELRIRNHSGGRLLAVGSIDGVNVLSGETAAPDQDGYVLDGYGSLAIAGWRKSLQRVAAFYFTALPDSYAARTGRPDDVGVIGMALFRERAPCCMQIEELSRDARPRAAPVPAPSAEAGSAAKAAPEAMDRLGTGHGRSEYSAAYETTFERNSAVPDELISIFYDSRRKLIAQGIIAEPRLAQRSPNPFPNGFVPDP
ncbi:MAG: hypothetical protein JWR07_711 [Nevskia sp.]|nr:hypothetical protein [Nevskia sp.]